MADVMVSIFLELIHSVLKKIIISGMILFILRALLFYIILLLFYISIYIESIVQNAKFYPRISWQVCVS